MGASPGTGLEIEKAFAEAGADIAPENRNARRSTLNTAAKMLTTDTHRGIGIVRNVCDEA